MEDFEGSEFFDKALIGWGEIIKQWHKEIKENIQLTSGLEAPYVHAEHGNTHLFGVAAAKAGYATIREVIGTRSGSSARLDLALVSETSLEIVESKWLEFNISKTFPKSRIIDKVNSACADAMTYENPEKLFSDTNRTQRRIGLTFIVPFYSSEESFDAKLVEQLIDKIKKAVLAVSPNLIAWSFLNESRKLAYWKRKYLGVIVIAKVKERTNNQNISLI